MNPLAAFLWLGLAAPIGAAPVSTSAQTPVAIPPPDPYEAASEKLKSSNPLVRRQGVEELGVLKDAKVIPTLTDALKDPHVFVRSAAADTLGLLRAPVAVLMLDLLDPTKEKEAAVRRSAATALAYLGDPSSADALVTALRDADPGVRYAAVRALGVLRVPKATEALSGLLADPDVGMRRTVIASLGQIRDPASADAFLKALKDSDVYVRLEAVKALGAIALPGTFEELRLSLKDEEATVRLQAAMVLSSLGDPSGVGTAIEALKEDKPALRQQAANILAIAGDAKAFAVLKAALKVEKDPSTKGMMEAALTQMKNRAAAETAAPAPLKTPPAKKKPAPQVTKKKKGRA